MKYTSTGRSLLSNLNRTYFRTFSSAIGKDIVIVSSYTRFDNLAHGPKGTEAKHGVTSYSFDQETGEMEFLYENSAPKDSDVMNSAYSCMHPKKNILYSCTETIQEHGEILSWNVCKDSGKLDLLSRVDAQGSSTCYIELDRDAKNALIVNYWNSKVAVLPIHATTGIMEDGKAENIYDPNFGREMRVSSTKHVNHSVNDDSAIKERQLDPHSHAVILDPYLGKIAFIPDLGLDIVRQMVYDGEKLRFAGSMRSGEQGVTKALGPRYTRFHPRMPILYIVNEIASEVAVFKFEMEVVQKLIEDPNCTDPCLTLLQTISTIPADFSGVKNTCGQITVHPSGDYVMASNRGHDSYVVYKTDPNSGLLSLVEFKKTEGKTPRNFQIHPSGKWVLCANQDTDDLTVFKFNEETGESTWMGKKYEVASPNYICCV